MAAARGISTSLQGPLAQWLRRRRAQRRRLARAVWELEERYGAAAFGIARNSARAPVGDEGRRFWRQVARRLLAR